MNFSFTKAIIMATQFTLKILVTLLLTMDFAAANNVSAQVKSVKDVQINLNIREANLITVFKEIEQKTNYNFNFSKDMIDLNTVVNLKFHNASVEQVLLHMSETLSLEFRQVNENISVSRRTEINPQKSISSTIDQHTVSGTITDENGSPLPGVSVVMKNTTNGTSTDIEGKFKLNVENGVTLVFSFIGYETIERVIEDDEYLNISMKLSIETLNEIVVTALGIEREERSLGYAVQEVDGKVLQKVPGVDVGTSLTGKVAGVLVQNSTDFNVEPRIFIRGEEASLIVIDGIAYANKRLSDIPAQDIESMSILKGATASALYGFRGEHGAIVITTKDGTTGEMGITVDFTTNTMFNAGFLAIPEKQSVYGRGWNGGYDINRTTSWGPAMDGTIRTQWDPFLKEYRDYEYLPVGKDNFENFLETGFVTNNNVNVGFRSDKIAVRSSLNWTEQKGVYPNSVLDKFTYTLGGDVKLNKFQLSSNTSYTKRFSPNMSSNGYTSYDVMYALLIYTSADFNLLDYKDNYWYTKDQTQNWTYPNGNINNPYFDRYEKINEVSRDIFNTDLTANYEFTDWLKATVRTGIDFYMDRGQISISQGSWTSSGNTSVPGIPYPWNGTRTGAYITGRTQGYSINSDFLLAGDKKFVDDKFALEYLAGGTIYYRRDDNLSAQTTGGISIPGYFSLNASVNPARVGETTNAEQANSLFGRFGVSWDEIIYLEATARNDWTSRLANAVVSKSDRSYFYPSVSGSFVISEFLPGSVRTWMDLLKVRSSWTKAKTAPSPYSINSVFNVNTGTWMDYNGATAPHTLYLDSYSPNEFTTVETGLHTIALNGRISFDIAYYNKRIYNQLVSAPRSPASGISSVYLNSGEERARRGLETIFKITPVKQDDLRWDITFNWSKYKEIYTKIDTLNTANHDRDWVAEGKRTDFYNIRDFQTHPGTGALIWENGLPKRNGFYTFYGYSNPDWQWGINTTAQYKNFSLFLSFDGVVGGNAWTVTESYMWQAGVHPESVTETRALDVAEGTNNYIGEGLKVISGDVDFDPSGNIISDTRVFEENDVAVSYQNAVRALHASSVWGGGPTRNDVYEKTFFKMREISLTYTIPNSLLQNWPIKSASISFVGQNVLFWAKEFKYSDPDGGSDDFADPSVRYLGGNIKFSF
ncbi:MAG: SusC/RagA family TonB-linked outer membrane protein [Cyclobacteriaceae bacterium]|jgi:TonB-linked SusC/RagA family outer membrane protein